MRKVTSVNLHSKLRKLKALKVVELSDNILVNEVYVAAKKYILQQVKLKGHGHVQWLNFNRFY